MTEQTPKVRRRDRRFDEPEWLDRLLEMGSIAHVAFVWHGEPMIHAHNFWWDGEKVYWHGAQAGQLREAVKAGPLSVAFSVSEHGRLLTAKTAEDFSTEYASVMLHGTVEAVDDLAEKERALMALVKKYAPDLEPDRDYEPVTEAQMKRVTVYRLEPTYRTGKHNIKPLDWPWVAEYPHESFIDLERAAGRVTMLPKDVAEYGE